MIQFFYQGVDMMEENVKLNACVMHDRAGGEADGLTAVFADPSGLWADWNPQRGDQVRLVDGDFDSGVLYVDDPRKSGGFFSFGGCVRATCHPPAQDQGVAGRAPV